MNKKKDKIFSLPYFAVYLGIIIMVYIVGLSFFKYIRIDLTKGNSQSISDVSKDLVDQLNDPLRIKIFLSKNLPPPLDAIERDLKDLLSSYSLGGSDYFQYKIYDCSEGKDETSEKIKANIKVAEEYGIYAQQVQSFEKDEVKLVKGYMGMAIQYGNMIEKIQRIDSTQGLEYKITGIIRKMINQIGALQGLSDSIQVKLYLPDNFLRVGPMFGIQGLETVTEKFNSAVKSSQDRNYGKLKPFTIVNGNDPNVKAEVANYRLRPLSWQNAQDSRGNRIEAGTGYASVVVEYNGKHEVIELLQVQQVFTGMGFRSVYQVVNLDGLSDQINNAVDGILDINQKIGYLKGKENLSIEQANPYMQQYGQGGQGGEAANLNTLLSKVYTLNEVEIDKIDQGLNTLIIAGTKTALTEYELFQIDQFLMKGRSVVFFQDALKEIPGNPQMQQFGGGQPTFEPNDTGLEKLIEHYGVTIKKEYVFDKESYINTQTDPMGRPQGQQAIYFVPKISQSQINKDFGVLENIKELYVIKISPLSLASDLEDKKIKAIPLFKSSKNSWTRSSISQYDQPPTDEAEFSQYELGYVLEGEFDSYFASRGIPSQDPSKETSVGKNQLENTTSENQFIKKGKPGKILVIGSSEILKNNVLDAEERTPNATMILNLIDYMSGNGGWALMRSKAQTYNPIEPFDDKAGFITKFFTSRTNIKIFNIGIVPILVGLIGFWIILRRRKKQKEIERIFL